MEDGQQLLHTGYLQPGYEPQYKMINASPWIYLSDSLPSEALGLSENVTIAVAAAASSTIGLSKFALLNILGNDNETGENKLYNGGWGIISKKI